MKPATFIILIVTLWPASSLAHQTRCNLTGWDDPVSPCQGSCSSSQAIYEQRPAGSRTYEYSSYTITAQTFESRCVYPNQTPGRWYPAQEQIQTFTCKSGYQWDDRNHICIRATCTATQQWNPATARCESACPTGTTFALTEANPQGICQLDCPAGYYRLSDSECQRCGSGTELVITPDDRSGTCLPFCPLGHLRNISGNCEPLLCPDGQVLHNGDCLPACPTGHIRNEAGHCEALLCRAGMVVFQDNAESNAPAPSNTMRSVNAPRSAVPSARPATARAAVNPCLPLMITITTAMRMMTAITATMIITTVRGRAQRQLTTPRTITPPITPPTAPSSTPRPPTPMAAAVMAQAQAPAAVRVRAQGRARVRAIRSVARMLFS